MNIRLTITIMVSKLIIKLCRLVGRGGTTLPGRIALILYPDILKVVSLQFKIVMVTGTNGKTTTARIMEQILEKAGIGYISNKSGANLASGITTTFMKALDLKGRCTAAIALLEIDEAAFRRITDSIKPHVLVVTNFFRDQLDRYGELSHVYMNVLEGLNKTPEAILILNSDDSMSVSLYNGENRKAIFYGIEQGVYKGIETSSALDAQFCIYCKSRYEYYYRTYGHLGGFNCPSCGFRRIPPQVSCRGIDEMTSSNSVIRLEIHPPNGTPCSGTDIFTDSSGGNSFKSQTFEVKMNLPGIFNIYNGLAAVSCALSMGIPEDSIINSLSGLKGSFGRMETIIVPGDRLIHISLVKNPAGFDQMLELLLTLDNRLMLAIAVNDRVADGKDVSWLWDVNLEGYTPLWNRVHCFFTSGTRAEDMSLRLKYAEIETGNIRMIKDYNELFAVAAGEMQDNGIRDFYIFTTYTAIAGIQEALKKYTN